MLWKLWVHYWRQAVSHPWEIGWPHRHQGATVFHFLLNYTLLFGWLPWHEHFEDGDSCQLFLEVLQTQVQPFLPFASMNLGSNNVSLQAVLSKLFRSIGSGCQIDFDFGTIWIGIGFQIEFDISTNAIVGSSLMGGHSLLQRRDIEQINSKCSFVEHVIRAAHLHSRNM